MSKTSVSEIITETSTTPVIPSITQETAEILERSSVDPVMISESKCLNTEPFCIPGDNKGLARYPPLRDYSLLKTYFERVHDKLSSLINDEFYGIVGNFQITFKDNEITYKIYMPYKEKSILPSKLFDTINKDNELKNYINLWITKIVQDYMVHKKMSDVEETTFNVKLVMALCRAKYLSGFHVDRYDDTVPCNYFTLTYMLPSMIQGRFGPFMSYNHITTTKILSLSMLSDHPHIFEDSPIDAEGNPIPRYITATMPVSDLGTVGITTYGASGKGSLSYHSTPIITTSRLSSKSEVDKNIGKLEAYHNPSIIGENIIGINNYIAIPLKNEEEDEKLQDILTNTNKDRRFLAAFYLQDDERAMTLFHENISFDCDTPTLLREVVDQINYIDIGTADPLAHQRMFDYFLGGERKRKSKQKSKQKSKRKSKRTKHKSKRFKNKSRNK